MSVRLHEEHTSLLIKLLQMNTITPMETGLPSEITRAQLLYANYAVNRLGGEVVYHESIDKGQLGEEGIPLSIYERAAEMGPSFWDNQTNMVIRFGSKRPAEQTIMFNFHMDTVDGRFPASFDGELFIGRGAVDMKGPGVALLAGIEAAIQQEPALLDDLTLLIQCVAGEEGGAMGVYGTKALVDKGYIGRLNVFAEPSDGVYFDRSSTSMTARIVVLGDDATDDAPHTGHNATVLLGFLAHTLMKELTGRIEGEGGKMCIAGIHTGMMHNKVYGQGQLLINLAYTSVESGRRMERWLEEVYRAALNLFTTEFSSLSVAMRTARDAHDICHLTWLKRGLPVLSNRDPMLEGLLNDLGWKRNPDDCAEHAFTCDAMWAQHPDYYTIVFGPGSLGGNHAHADGEYIELQELEKYAGQIRDLVCAYHEHASMLKSRVEEMMR